MKKITLLFAIIIGSINLNAQIFDFTLADETETNAFIAAMPGNGFVGVNTVSGQFGGTWGVKFNQNSSLTYDATGLAAGDYEMEITVLVQNTAVLPWTQDAWLTSGSTPTTSAPSDGTNGTFVTLTKTVTLTAGDNTFGIVRGGSGSQLVVNHWKVTYLGGGGSSMETDITSFSLAEQAAAATIDAGAHTVTMEVTNGTSLASLSATIGLSVGASVLPNSGAAQDFTSTVDYTVTAEDGLTSQVWAVTVTEADPVAAGNIFDFTIADETETNAFIAAMPGNGFVGVNTVSGQFGGTWGVKLNQNSSLTYDATGLAAGDYEMEITVLVQNTAVLPWTQDAWLTSGSAPTTSAPSDGTNGTFVTLTKTVTLTAGDNTFGIVRGGSGSQLVVNHWKVDYLGSTLSLDEAELKNNFSVSKTGVTLKNVSGNIQILDLLGRVLVSKNLESHDKLNYNFKSTSIYMVKLSTVKGNTTKKVVFK